MTANDLANELKCHVMRYGDCIVVSGGREICDSIHLAKTKQEREVVDLTLKPIKKARKHHV